MSRVDLPSPAFVLASFALGTDKEKARVYEAYVWLRAEVERKDAEIAELRAECERLRQAVKGHLWRYSSKKEITE